jgi:hypothetical protein
MYFLRTLRTLKIYNFSNINIILFIKYFFREGIMFCADDNGDEDDGVSFVIFLDGIDVPWRNG